MQATEPATVLIITVAAIIIAITGYAIYTAFGPPGKTLMDPFEEHED
jgi:PsbN protein